MTRPSTTPTMIAVKKDNSVIEGPYSACVHPFIILPSLYLNSVAGIVDLQLTLDEDRE